MKKQVTIEHKIGVVDHKDLLEQLHKHHQAHHKHKHHHLLQQPETQPPAGQEPAQ